MIKLSANYSKKLGLPKYSSHKAFNVVGTGGRHLRSIQGLKI